MAKLKAAKRGKAASAQIVLPQPGDAFLMPLKDGRFGVCRVLRQVPTEDWLANGGSGVLVATSRWIGKSAPKVNDPRLKEILVLDHHNWKMQKEINWLSDPVPRSFRRLGMIPPSKAEARMKCWSTTGWEALPLQLYSQWRWDHERTAMLRDDAKKSQAEERKQAAADKRYQKYLAGLTLKKLRKKRLFSTWTGAVADEAIAACRDIFRQTIESLLALGSKPTGRARLAVLRQCINQLNHLDRKRNGFIATIEREDLCEAFDDIVHASGLRGYENLADRWRDW